MAPGRRRAQEGEKASVARDTLTDRATIAAVRQNERTRLVEVDATVTRRADGVHLRGRATFVLP